MEGHNLEIKKQKRFSHAFTRLKQRLHRRSESNLAAAAAAAATAPAENTTQARGGIASSTAQLLRRGSLKPALALVRSHTTAQRPSIPTQHTLQDDDKETKKARRNGISKEGAMEWIAKSRTLDHPIPLPTAINSISPPRYLTATTSNLTAPSLSSPSASSRSSSRASTVLTTPDDSITNEQFFTTPAYEWSSPRNRQSIYVSSPPSSSPAPGRTVSFEQKLRYQREVLGMTWEEINLANVRPTAIYQVESVADEAVVGPM